MAGRLLHSCCICGAISEQRHCPQHARRSPYQRGYQREFLRNRAKLLKSKPPCCVPGCLVTATVADHQPDRAALLSMGVTNPDAIEHLRPMCRYHHNLKTLHGYSDDTLAQQPSLDMRSPNQETAKPMNRQSPPKTPKSISIVPQKRAASGQYRPKPGQTPTSLGPRQPWPTNLTTTRSETGG